MKKYKKQIIDYMIPIFIGGIVVTLLVLPQLVNHIGFTGDDTVFHFSRFYDTAEQIKNHNFSYFQMNYGMGQTGRIINAIYGPFFSYLMGILVLLAGSWFRFQIILTYLLFIIGAIGFFKLSRKVNVSRIVSSIVTILFLTTGYVFYWIYSNNGNCLGAFIMPYVIIQGIDFINADEKGLSWIKLGVTIAVLAQIHLLSTFLAILVLLPFFIYSLVYSKNKKKIWVNVGKAIALFTILTANIWGAFIYLYSTNLLSAPLNFPVDDSALNLFIAGNTTMWKTITDVTLIIICLQLIYVILNYKNEKINTFVTIEGIAFLFISSNLFPWKYITHIFPIVSSYFQFPNRFTAVAYPLLYLGIGLTITELVKNDGIKLGIIASSLVLLVALCNLRSDSIEVNNKVTFERSNPQRIEQMRDKNFKVYFEENEPINPDYLPIQRKISSWKIEKIVFKKLAYNYSFNKTVISDGRLQLKWQEKNNGKQRQLPITMYHQSQLILNGKKVDPTLNVIGMPKVTSKRGENTAILSFKISPIFNALLYISLVGWIGLMFYGLVQLIKHLRN
ncbi:cell division protein [Lactobacillus taiwanensis]|nr:cell division protein [Lactobacillus taiwanensis]